jgi:hypothetical protein
MQQGQLRSLENNQKQNRRTRVEILPLMDYGEEAHSAPHWMPVCEAVGPVRSVTTRTAPSIIAQTLGARLRKYSPLPERGRMQCPVENHPRGHSRAGPPISPPGTLPESALGTAALHANHFGMGPGHKLDHKVSRGKREAFRLDLRALLEPGRRLFPRGAKAEPPELTIELVAEVPVASGPGTGVALADVCAIALRIVPHRPAARWGGDPLRGRSCNHLAVAATGGGI